MAQMSWGKRPCAPSDLFHPAFNLELSGKPEKFMRDEASPFD